MVSMSKLFVLHVFSIISYILDSRMCKVMVIKSDGPIMIGKLQLVLKMCKNNALLTYIC